MFLWSRAKASALAAAAATALLSFAAGAEAADLRDALFGQRADQGRRAATPPVARYVADDGGAFVLDLTATRPLLKFDSSPEVWALSPSPAPRGDVIYRNDLGQPVLRATRLGGVTVFTSLRPTGEAAALAGASGPLRLPQMGPAAVLQALKVASIRASRAAKHLIAVEAEDVTPEGAALIADAALVASEAVVRLSARKDTRSLARVGKISLTEGATPSVKMSGGVMQISVAPAMGLAGRPSSERIAHVASR